VKPAGTETDKPAQRNIAMRDHAKPYTGKVIVFQFQGGMRDGESIRSDVAQRGLNEALAFWAVTRKGSGGQRFDVPMPGGAAVERYKVVGKNETDSEINVICQYVY
jgi:hypothetical protein